MAKVDNLPSSTSSERPDGTGLEAVPETGTLDERATSLARRLVAALWPVAFFFLLGIVMTWPLVTNLTGSVIRHPILSRSVDVDEERWNLWWFKTAIVDRHRNPFYTDMLYYPYRQADNPLNLYYNDMHPLDMMLGMPALLITGPETGPTLAYNLLTLFHMTLTACAMFWLVRYLTGSTAGGIVGGILLTYSPLNQYQVQAGHLVLLAMGWMLLHLLFLHKLLYSPPSATRRQRLIYGGASALFLAATTYTNWYLSVFILVIGVLVALTRIWERPHGWRTTVLGVAAVLGVWLVLVSPYLIGAIRAMNDPTYGFVSGIDYEVTLSISPLDLLGVTKDNRVSPAIWTPGTLGFSALVLGVLGIIRMRKRSALWVLLIVVGIIMALGPYLKLNDAQEVSQTTGVPLPYLLFRELPFMAIARVPRRFILLAHLGLGVLAGGGVAYLLHQARRWSRRLPRPSLARLLPAGVIALVVIVPLAELATLPQPVQAVSFSPFLTKLAQDSSAPAILELPVTTHYARDHDRMLNMTIADKKIIGGYLSRRVYDYYEDPSSPFRGIAELKVNDGPDIIPPLSPFAVLNFYDIPYVVAYKQSIAYERPEDRARVDEYVRHLYPDPSAAVADDAQLTAYRVPPSPGGGGPLIWLGDDWYPPETDGKQTWRWSGGESSVFVTAKAPVSMRLQITAHTLQGESDIQVLVNGTAATQLHLAPAPTQASPITLSLPAGQSRVVLKSSAPAVSPMEAGISKTDNRKLSFVVTGLKMDPIP